MPPGSWITGPRHIPQRLMYNGANNSTLSVSSFSESTLSTEGRSLIVVPTLTLYGGELWGLLHPVSTRVDELSADSFKVFFTYKVDAIRAKTESATSPSITVREVPPLDLFQEVTSDEIYSVIRTAPITIAHWIPHRHG